jgi:hypothetical protein
MLSRTLILATVMLWIGCFASEQALAQENLEAGKSPSQIFAGTCNACHKSPRGLLKTVAPGSLPGFLRQHYTTSPNMANVLAAYLVSNGASDPRAAAASPKGGKEGSKEGAKEAKQEAKPVEQLDRFGRRQHPATAPQEAAVPAGDRPPEMQQPAQAASKLPAKQKLTKRGKPGEELPKEEPAAATEPPDTAKVEPGKPEGSSPAVDSPPQSAKIETPKEAPALRPDPVPPVTPAPPSTPPAAATAAPPPTATAAAPAATTAPPPAQPASAASPAVSAAAAASGGGNSEPLPVMSLPTPPSTAAASAPALPPVPPAGPPAPPISQ